MRLKLCLLLVFIITYSWSQTTQTFTSSGTFTVPTGVTNISVQAWGGGGSGGGASGAGLLFGRGAAGGGGGAYASATLTVTPGEALNVVVAGTTSGTTGANGSAGGNSTITGYQASLLAAGGSGGAANNSGGNPIGGNGGSVAASVGTTRLAGIKGGDGCSWSLLSLLLSSGAGGAGANSGGAGGAAVASLILGTAPGNAGSPPGGAGSGAINSALGSAQVGGAGAAGKVIISYTIPVCPTYALTSTTATNICLSNGTETTVTVTSNPLSLPIGNYVVDYGTPGTIGATANMTVSTAGTGTFTTVPGLVNVTSSSIVITKLTSGSCSSDITSNNSVLITISPATVGGTVNGGDLICSGSSSPLLTLSGYTGTVVKWQSAADPFTTWVDIANTGTTYTSGPLTENTRFRAVVQSGVCPAVNSGETTVKVSPAAVGGTIGGWESPVSGGVQAFLTLSGHTGSVVKWQSSISPFSTWVDIANTSASYTSGILTETTQFRVVVQNGICTANSAINTVIVEPAPTIVISNRAENICLSGDDGSYFTSLSYSGATGSPVTYSIVWDSSPANSFVEVTDAALPASPIIIVVPASSVSGTYTGTLTVKNANGISSSGSIFSVGVSVNPIITSTGIIDSVCSSANVQNATLTYSAITDNPTGYYINWDSTANAASLADQSGTSFAFSSSGGSINTIMIPANVPAGTYSGTMYIGKESCPGTQPVSLTIVPATVGGTVSGGDLICSGNTSGLLTLSGHTGSVVKWQFAIDPFTAWEDIANTSTTYTSGPLTEDTRFRAVVQSGVCSAVNSVETTVKTSPLPTITTSGSISGFCSSSDFGSNKPLYYSATTGSPVTYSIVWNSSPGSSFETVIDEALPEDAILIWIPAETPGGIYTGTITVKNEMGCVSSGTTFTVNVDTPPTIITEGKLVSVCSSNDLQLTTLIYDGSMGNPTVYSIDWYSAANAALLKDQRNTPFTFIPSGGIINTIEIPANVPAGTYSGELEVSNGLCYRLYPISITISPAVAGGALTTVILRDYETRTEKALLTLSGHTGSVVKWQSAISPFTTWVDIDNTSATHTSEVLTETIQFRAVVQSGDCTANSEITIFIVEPAPTITLSSSALSLCATNNSNASTVALDYTVTTGNPTTYSIVWSFPANSFIDVTDEVLSASPIMITVPAGVTAGTYTGILTVKNDNGAISPDVTFTIEVKETPLITIFDYQPITTVCASSNLQHTILQYDNSSGNATSYSIDWDSTANAAFLADQPITPHEFNTFGGSIDSIQISANAEAGVYSGILQIFNGTCSKTYEVSIRINSLPKSPIVGEIIAPTTTVSTGSVALSRLPMNGNWSIETNPVTVTIWGTGESTVISGLEPGTYTFTVNNGNCTSEESRSALIPGTWGKGTLVKPITTAGTLNNQFESSKTTVTKDFESGENRISVVTFNKVINVNAFDQNINKVFVYDVSGNLIYKKDTVNDSKLVIDNLRSSNQILIVKVVLDNNQTQTKKVIY